MTLMEFAEILRGLWLVWMMLFFSGIVAWAFWPGNRARFEEDGRIPFREDRA